MRLAVVCPFHGRHDSALPLLHRLYVDGTRRPDECWIVCETDDDKAAVMRAFQELYDLEAVDGWPEGLHVEVVETPRVVGRYSVLPYAHKINWALDRVKAAAVVYLDNGSMPEPRKYELMLKALRGRKAVYCGQRRTGHSPQVMLAEEPVEDGYCCLNFTQVMHRRTADRWPTDLSLGNPDLADGVFWRTLHERVGPFYPVAGEPLDSHHIPDVSAAGL